MTTTTTRDSMERTYGVRYEAAPGFLFPVTHELGGGPAESALASHHGGAARWAHVQIGNLEHISWCVRDVAGRTLVHGTETNHARTYFGYVRALKRALGCVRLYGARRVSPRNAEHRQPQSVKLGYTGAPRGVARV